MILNQQPSARVVLTGQVTLSLNSTSLQTVGLTSSMWLGARFAAFAAPFMNIRVKSVCVEPVNMPVAQYLIYALLPTHLPALLSSYDAVPLNPGVIANVATLPGAVTFSQGSADQRRCTLRLPPTYEMQCSRVNSDLPPIANLVVYGTQITTFMVFTEVVFKDYIAFI